MPRQNHCIGFVLITITLFYSSIASGCKQNQQEYFESPSLPILSSQNPGIMRLMEKIHQEGNAFEIESTIKLARDGESILGFDLDITFRNGYANIMLDGHMQRQPTTEIDIITSHYAVECKSSKNPSKTSEIQQFLKEQRLIRWLGNVLSEYNDGQLAIFFKLIGRHHRPFLILVGPSTNFEKVELTSTWFTHDTAEECIEQFVNIMHLLESKEVLIFFKYPIIQEFTDKLIHEGLHFEDNIQIPTALRNHIRSRKPTVSIDKHLEKLNRLFSQMTIDTIECTGS